MPDWLLPLSLFAALLAIAVLMIAAFRRPAASGADGFAMLATQLEALAASQERQSALTADRLAQQDRMLGDRLAETASRLDVALAGQNARLAANQLAMTERLAAQEKALATRLGETLAAQSERLTRTLADSAQKAQDTAGQIQERLAVIDAARQNMEALGTQVGTLAAILGNKQARGAFGEMQLRQLIEDRLPPDGFVWQHVLSNGTRCDCLIQLPFPPGPIVVDSKFPLEAWQALQEAADDAPLRLLASRRFSTDMRRHVSDISEKYLIAGETADAAILFVPSEAVFFELHTAFTPLVDEAQRRRVYIASPTTLWAMLSAMRALMQDVRMRAQTGRIKEEVSKLVQDVKRLDDRVAKLKGHFSQAQNDIRDIEISTDKIVRVGGRIEQVEIEDAPAPAALTE
jgi:DNA recombination protein RmuC